MINSISKSIAPSRQLTEHKDIYAYVQERENIVQYRTLPGFPQMELWKLLNSPPRRLLGFNTMTTRKAHMRRPANEKQQHQLAELIPQTPDQPNISTRRLTLFAHVYTTKRFAHQENVYWFSGVDRCSICAYARNTNTQTHDTGYKCLVGLCMCNARAIVPSHFFFVKAHRLRCALLSRASEVLLCDSLKHTHT